MNRARAVARYLVGAVLRRGFNPLFDTALAERLPFIRSGYSFWYRRMVPLGLYEPGVVKVVRRLLQEGATFVDLGAHRGYYTLLASRLVGDRGNVFAFEPAPGNFSFLEMNTRGRRNVSLVQKAVSNQTGSTRLYLGSRDGLVHTIYDTGEHRRWIEVETTTLDDFFRAKDGRADVVKMDVEGAEMMALEGMLNTIRANEGMSLITEFQPGALEAAGYSPKEYLRALEGCGFRLRVIGEDGNVAAPATVDGLMRVSRERPGESTLNMLCERGHLMAQAPSTSHTTTGGQ